MRTFKSRCSSSLLSVLRLESRGKGFHDKIEPPACPFRSLSFLSGFPLPLPTWTSGQASSPCFYLGIYALSGCASVWAKCIVEEKMLVGKWVSSSSRMVGKIFCCCYLIVCKNANTIVMRPVCTREKQDRDSGPCIATEPIFPRYKKLYSLASHFRWFSSFGMFVSFSLWHTHRARCSLKSNLSWTVYGYKFWRKWIKIPILQFNASLYASSFYWWFHLGSYLLLSPSNFSSGRRRGILEWQPLLILFQS